jgi:hypothetical protein
VVRVTIFAAAAHDIRDACRRRAVAQRAVRDAAQLHEPPQGSNARAVVALLQQLHGGTQRRRPDARDGARVRHVVAACDGECDAPRAATHSEAQSRRRQQTAARERES